MTVLRQFSNFCKFTNRNTRLLFKHQCLKIFCSILLQKMQLSPLHMIPMEAPILTPWRDLAFFVLRQSPKCHICGNIKGEWKKNFTKFFFFVKFFFMNLKSRKKCFINFPIMYFSWKSCKKSKFEHFHFESWIS